ncbi:sigma 54-interacting transcriptional regulator [Allorhodopirellula solitaria]|uniref:Transcriptional regulatory protein ZraR n=1 Tax=Allorhodopirellula solitaria TaxID=2527987 RepID=A0A5C5YJV8_9BACT|nr:sigma 54-interacting transcriptional regulator [Allorhodopirellula solitaria]TWT75138.1 Transcriptional regulatory protein ZraR [Allorhodopirellula solitaria]
MDAYLVLHHGARWTDVYRLANSGDVILGRSSQNQIVLRSGRASRQHARVFHQDRGWFVEDLASRNGVFINDSRVNSQHPSKLTEGDRLQVAGFEMRFTHDLARWAGPASTAVSPDGGDADFEEGATEDAMQLGDDFSPDPESQWLDIVSQSPAQSLQPTQSDARRAVRPVHTIAAQTPPADGSDAASHSLLQMAFAMGRLECPAGDWEAAATLLLETLAETLASQLPMAEIGLYLFAADQDLPLPRHVHQRAGHRYRRPPENLVRQIRAPGAAALLARNVLGDRHLATADTRGEIDVESLVLAPLQVPIEGEDAAEGPPRPARGLVHATTGSGDASLAERDLALIVTACEIFCQACQSLHQRHQLEQTLHQSQQTISRLRKQLAGRVEILGRSKAIADVQVQIAQVARTHAAVLLRGESGSGKELVASAIHVASERADGPLVCLNCAALSKDLLESELFGHEKGAFTGATDSKKGKFEAASGGTLMLDEIGEMGLDLQAKLLRVLEGHPFERVGGQSPVRVDVRVIAATHRDLQEMVRKGEFRQDLFYRLHVIEIVVPPLRQRGRDIVLLAEHFVASFVQSMGRMPMSLSRPAKQKLLDYSWPGNVRELRNVIERAVVMAPLDSRGPHEIDTADLLLTPAQEGGRLTPPPVESPATVQPPAISLAELERQHIEQTLQSTGGNKSKAAGILKIERSTLDRKLKRYAEHSGKS